MTKVITYGTYDLLHYGHINLLKNAKALGDYLIVGVTSDAFDMSRGKINVQQPLLERVEAVRKTGLADEIIVEEYEGQKIDDIRKYGADIFTVGSDWVGKFDYLNEFCKVVYLPRTQGVSSTEERVKRNDYIRIGIIGEENPAERFIRECRTVPSAEIAGITGTNEKEDMRIANAQGIAFYENREELYENCDAVYIVERLDHHARLIRDALKHGKHVMCKCPMFLSEKEARECFDYAKEHGLILFDEIKTKCFPAYKHLLVMVESGRIGEIKDIEVSFSQKFKDVDYGKLNKYQGSLFDQGGYIFLPIIQMLGRDYEEMHIFTSKENDFDLFTKGIIKYPNAVASFKAGLGVKTEGQLIITGTEGYVYIPAPWWKTDYFEIRHEDLRDTKKCFWRYEGDGFRYEIIEFLKRIQHPEMIGDQFEAEDSIAIAGILEKFNQGNYTLF